MPSTGRGSTASTASENSLAMMPMLCTASASTPASGPSPTATTNSSANTISLMARQASISRRTGCTTHCGQTLAEREDGERDAEEHGERGAPHGDLDRLHHLPRVGVPVVEVGAQEAGTELRHVAPVGDERGDLAHLGRPPAPGEQGGDREPQQPVRARAGRGRCGTAMGPGPLPERSAGAGDGQRRVSGRPLSGNRAWFPDSGSKSRRVLPATSCARRSGDRPRRTASRARRASPSCRRQRSSRRP